MVIGVDQPGKNKLTILDYEFKPETGLRKHCDFNPGFVGFVFV